MALLHGGPDFHVGVWNPGDLVLALHDPIRPHHRRSRGPAFQPDFHVLGRGPFRLPAYAYLHSYQLPRLQRQDHAVAPSLLELKAVMTPLKSLSKQSPSDHPDVRFRRLLFRSWHRGT